MNFCSVYTMKPYRFEFQTDIVQCCFLLHDFVNLNQSMMIQLYDDNGKLGELVADDNKLPDEIINYDELKEMESQMLRRLISWRKVAFLI